MAAATTLVIGRGELYFGKFLPGTLQSEGELYFGNTPGFSVSRDLEVVERFTSYGGQKIPLKSEVVREAYAADMTTDNISMDNLALWFAGTQDASGQEPVGTITETFTVKRGRHYQLGFSFEPFGVRHVEPDISFEKGGVPLTVSGNLELRLEEGRFFILPNATGISDGDALDVTFQWRQSRSTVLTPNATELVGSLRFISTNPIGPRKSYFFPYVSLKPSGEIDLKADQWQQFSFALNVRQLNPLTKLLYVVELAPAEFTEDENAIIELGPMPLDEFPFWEDELDRIINFSIPAADYGAPITYP